MNDEIKERIEFLAQDILSAIDNNSIDGKISATLLLNGIYYALETIVNDFEDDACRNEFLVELNAHLSCLNKETNTIH